MLTRLLVCGATASARLAELAYSRRNIRGAGVVNEGAASRKTYPAMIALHTAVIATTALRGGQTRLPWLALLLAMQPLRLWVLLTLGQRWNTRGAVPATMTVATGGPYAHVRHPNYSIVAVELLSLPLAFGLKRLALASTVLNAGLLALRIRDEERLLRQLPGYAEHFDTLPRFLPGLKTRTPA